MSVENPGQMQALERQLGAGWRWLRFEAALESDFQKQYRIWALPFRLTLIGIAAFFVALTPLLDMLLLHPPADFMRPANASQIFVMLPVLIVAWLCTRLPQLRVWSDPMAVLAVMVVAGGLLFQRRLGAQYGVWVPTELITVTMAGAYVMGGLGFRRMTPLAVLLVIAVGINEIQAYGNNPNSQYIIFGVVVQLSIIGLAGYLQEHFARGAWLRGQLMEILATRDPLTGLLNFRAFEQRYQQLFSVAARERKPILIALLDLDYFKQYNDAYGHAAGNTCLCRIADHFAASLLRDSDIKARMGGEEFVVALHDIDRFAGERKLEELRASIQALAIPHQRTLLPTKVVTASIGALWCFPHAGMTAEAALHEADRCLYAAKDAGRNRVVFNQTPPGVSIGPA